MSELSFRVFFVTHHQGRLTGILMRRFDLPFDDPPPSAYGEDEVDVYAQLEQRIIELEAEDEDDVDRYLWHEEFSTRRLDVEVHPQSFAGMRSVIGKQRVPLRITCAVCKIAEGAYRAMLPRFGWWFVVEDVSILSDVVENAISGALLGGPAAWIYDYRYEGPEYVRAWKPAYLAKRARSADERADELAHLPTLVTIAEELVGKAERKRLPDLVGSDPLFDANRHLIDRTPSPSLLLVGASGVGKTAFVHRLARHCLAVRRGKHGPRRTIRVWATSASRIVAGMVYLGMWQERCLDVVRELSSEGDFLYVDRLIDVLRAQPDGSSIADFFAPAVASGEISVIAECDEIELEECRQRNPRFLDLFHIVRVPEIDQAPLVALLEHYHRRKRADLDIHPDALLRMVSHLRAFRPDVRFPGKAIQFLDWLHREPQSEGAARVLPADMSAAFSRYSGLPVELISDDVPAGADDIAARLRAAVIGQDQACDTCARVLARFKAGLNDPARPVGTLFFVGPTGVGKTELAKQLARYMFGDPRRLVRVDMSEYMVGGASQRLLEVGPGVTSLAERVRAQPLCVVLLDEIEKAHPEVFDLLLGVLGEGRLTDSAGRLCDFRMAVIVMTSNLGASEAAEVGFGDRSARDYARSVMRHFRPELFNRLDYVLSFRKLAMADVEQIVDLELAKIAERVGLGRRNLTLELAPEARHHLASLGYDPDMGARPLKRVLEERVVTPLAVRMSEDPGFRDRRIAVVVGEGEGEDRGPDVIAIGN